MRHFFITHKKTFFAMLFVILFSTTISFADRANPYTAGETLDPDCAPGSGVNCTVHIAGGGGGTNGWDSMLAQNQVQTQDRTIDVNNKYLRFSNINEVDFSGVSGQNTIEIVEGQVNMGDIGGVGNGVYFSVDSPNNKIYSLAGGNPAGLNLDFNNQIYELGDYGHNNDATTLSVDNTHDIISTYSGSNNYKNSGIYLDYGNADFYYGDYGHNQNGTAILLDDLAQTQTFNANNGFTFNTDNGGFIVSGSNSYHYQDGLLGAIISGRIAFIGDNSGDFNSTSLLVNDNTGQQFIDFNAQNGFQFTGGSISSDGNILLTNGGTISANANDLQLINNGNSNYINVGAGGNIEAHSTTGGTIALQDDLNGAKILINNYAGDIELTSTLGAPIKMFGGSVQTDGDIEGGGKITTPNSTLFSDGSVGLPHAAINVDGGGYLSNGNFSWDAGGNITTYGDLSLMGGNAGIFSNGHIFSGVDGFNNFDATQSGSLTIASISDGTATLFTGGDGDFYIADKTSGNQTFYVDVAGMQTTDAVAGAGTLSPAWKLGSYNSTSESVAVSIGGTLYNLSTHGVALDSNNSFIVGGAGSFGANINSVYVGFAAGTGANDANNSNFLGANAGLNAQFANHSNFFGADAGNGAINASVSNFIGYQAGYGAVNATGSNFLGQDAGHGATYATNSNFFGFQAGYGALGSNSSPFNSNFFGYQAGYGDYNLTDSNFFGYQAGYIANTAISSNFFGNSAGYGATNAAYANFMGFYAGYGAGNANGSNFFGRNAGDSASNASYSNFIGFAAGKYATNAQISNFIGIGAGLDATNASESNFFGDNTGRGATNASNAIFIGASAGYNDAVNNVSTGGFSILIGPHTNTGGYSNSIAIGGSATNTATNQFMIGSTSFPINTTVIKGASTQCTITTGTGIACSSDASLKKNIVAVQDGTLAKVLALRPVTYNWNDEQDTDPTHIGFIAQEVETVFPQVVSIDPATHLRLLSTTSLIPYTIKAIQEMHITITSVIPDTLDSTAYGKIKEFLREIATEGKAVVDIVQTHTLCVDDVCVTRDQFKNMVQQAGQQQSAPSVVVPVAPSTTPVTTPTPVSSDATVVDPVVTPTPSPVVDTTPAPASSENQ
ncbi:MAG: tail fiber domain-containing protein [bacterium]